MKSESSGSGVIISPDGHAVTNHHVAANAERIMCTLADRREVEARLVGTDALADIAVIKLISPDSGAFPSARWGDSSNLGVGDRVFAMGSPFALSQSVTMGIVSNTEMIMPGFASSRELLLDGEDVGSIVKWIGHDALIRPGNSGGPLVNQAGEIVGINEISLGLSGAIPSNLARTVAEEIIRTGKVTRSWLGIDAQPLLRSSSLEAGVLVGGILPDSPAQRAGVMPGDVILSLAGKETTARFREEIPLFNQLVASFPVGSSVRAVLLRDGKQMTVDLTTVERQKAAERQHEIRNWGVCATNITYLIQKEMRLRSQDGVLITSVRPSGPAGTAKPGIRENDVIVSVGGKPVRDVADMRAVTRELADDGAEQRSVLVTFLRKSRQYVTVVRIGADEPARRGAEISKAWLPVEVQVLTRDLAAQLGVRASTGVRVTQVHDASCGLEVGDLILKVDGDPVPAEHIGDEEVLPSLIRQYEIGAEVSLEIVRAGEALEKRVKLESSPMPPRDYPKYENVDFEFVARDIAFSDRADASVEEDVQGAYVESVSEGSWVALAELRSGDVITAVDGVTIRNLEDLKTRMAEVSRSRPEVVVFSVRRGIRTRFLEIRPEWPTDK